jgi:hypothetical protein
LAAKLAPVARHSVNATAPKPIANFHIAPDVTGLALDVTRFLAAFRIEMSSMSQQPTQIRIPGSSTSP